MIITRWLIIDLFQLWKFLPHLFTQIIRLFCVILSVVSDSYYQARHTIPDMLLPGTTWPPVWISSVHICTVGHMLGLVWCLQAYHSQFTSPPQVVGNMALLPLRTQIKGPAAKDSELPRVVSNIPRVHGFMFYFVFSLRFYVFLLRGTTVLLLHQFLYSLKICCVLHHTICSNF